MHPWQHYVALGDSFTQGVGDPVEGFARLGVVDRLAAACGSLTPISASPTWHNTAWESVRFASSSSNRPCASSPTLSALSREPTTS